MNVGEDRARLHRITMSNQTEVDMTGVDCVDSLQNGNRWRETDTRKSMQPLRETDCFVVVGYVKRGADGQLLIGRRQILEQFDINIRRGEEDLAEANGAGGFGSLRYCIHRP